MPTDILAHRDQRIGRQPISAHHRAPAPRQRLRAEQAERQHSGPQRAQHGRPVPGGGERGGQGSGFAGGEVADRNREGCAVDADAGGASAGRAIALAKASGSAGAASVLVHMLERGFSVRLLTDTGTSVPGEGSDGFSGVNQESADAAGLSVFAGLARYEEVERGDHHALRITVPRSRDSYVWPARHAASSSSDANLPPMGLRLRPKSEREHVQAAQAGPRHRRGDEDVRRHRRRQRLTVVPVRRTRRALVQRRAAGAEEPPRAPTSRPWTSPD